ncbi:MULTISPECIES: hypothetical protein [Photorhabdus]|uniref:hypothetical protein n=1 Tax=Photorhabdus TaxID=29487 RepID=UPI000A7C952C|nr:MULTISPECIES: hypothetical protein [Photorhabdus]NDK94500.1 hypothetical protein [Photorhabdus laumondii subsp. laumondii]NDL17052.1 hypothetical protein [Photorhabdus laumondii subsp. laumondii]
MNNIYIIGPFGAGKTMLSKLISKKLEKELISLDSIPNRFQDASRRQGSESSGA